MNKSRMDPIVPILNACPCENSDRCKVVDEKTTSKKEDGIMVTIVSPGDEEPHVITAERAAVVIWFNDKLNGYVSINLFAKKGESRDTGEVLVQSIKALADILNKKLQERE